MRDTREFEFGGFRLDPARRLLFNTEGETIPLSSRAFDTLLHFLENPGALLTKQSMLKAIWPDSIVEENNLTQCVLALRRALGEAPGDHRFIVTMTGRGYRFVAPVHVREVATRLPAAPLVAALPEGSFATAVGPDLEDLTSEADEDAPPVHTPRTPAMSPRGWWITRLVVPVLCLAIVLFSQLAERPLRGSQSGTLSIAVLPFVDFTVGRTQEFFAEGIADTLLTHLGDLPGLRVVSLAPSFAARSRTRDLQGIGRALGADHVLEGTVQTTGSRLRVSVQLIDTTSGARLWSRSYERRPGNTLALREELAQTIAAELAVLLGPAVDGEVAGIDLLGHGAQRLRVAAGSLASLPTTSCTPARGCLTGF